MELEKSLLSWRPCADTSALVMGSEHRLVAALAPELSSVSEKRGKGTVAERFREELRDLVQRLEEYVTF